MANTPVARCQTFVVGDPEPIVIRPLVEGDRGAVLHLNAANYPAVAPLDSAALEGLLKFEGDHFVAVDGAGVVVGYLLSFPRESGYDDTEMCALRRLLPEPFIYICQIAIAPEYRRQGLGGAFYQRVEAVGHRRDARILCCDVNTNPPNAASLAFHRRLGFAEIAAGLAGDGRTEIAFLARKK